MKTFCELYIEASPERLKRFISEIQEYATGDWCAKIKNDYTVQWIEFDYSGNHADPAAVFIITNKYLSTGQLRVNNIVPLEKNQLSIDEYNCVLRLFNKDVIEPYKKTHSDIDISQPTSDIFDPKTVISELALDKLKSFCYLANKSTGSSHPDDQERWFDFICQTVDDDRIFDADTLAKFLQDESYWGKKEDDFHGVMGDFAWDEEHAWQLATEYEGACELLKYYIRKRG